MKKVLSILMAALMTASLLAGCGSSSSSGSNGGSAAPSGGSSAAASTATSEPSYGNSILTFGTGDTGGSLYPAGAALSQVWTNQLDRVKCNTQTSTGSFQNVQDVASGEVDVAVATADVVLKGYSGQGKFTEALDNVRVIGAVYTSVSSGTVKRMPLSALRNIRTSGIRALTLDEGDELINVMRTDGGQNILMATHNGQAICFAETDVRPMGREAVGVRGIRLRDGDWVVGAEIAQPDAGVLSITENGYGKRTPAADYIRGGEEPQHRGGSGMKNYNITDKTGPVAAVKVVYDTDDVLVVSDDGVIIRMEAAGISELGRATQGVRIMRLSEGARVISVALTDRAESEDAATAEEPEA